MVSVCALWSFAYVWVPLSFMLHAHGVARRCGCVGVDEGCGAGRPCCSGAAPCGAIFRSGWQPPPMLFPGLLPPLPGLVFRQVGLSALDTAHAIEAASYPPDEAASRAKLELRMTKAAPYFWGAFDAAALDAEDESGALRGFVCGTLTLDERLCEESMSVHQPEGRTLCIHSVVVPEAMRRRGMGGWMLRSYLERVAEAGRVEQVLLLCKAPLERFYASAGFESLGDSGVAHGADPWTLMRLRLTAGREAESGADAAGAPGGARAQISST